MRRWNYTGQDVYVDDLIRWEKASVIHDERRETLTIKGRENGSREVGLRLSLTEVVASAPVKVGKERHRSFTGLNDEGTFLVVTAVKKDCGCSGR